MDIGVIGALFLGICAGIVTGLVPGVHVNMVSALLLSSSAWLLQVTDALTISVFIISMAVIHTFLDTIPSIYLGAPDAENILAALPGHKMLLEGRGYEAVKLTIIGSFGGLIIVIFLTPVLLVTMGWMQALLEPWIGWILAVLVMWMIIREKNKIAALFLFLFSGALGIFVLQTDMSQPLFPLLSGLFGVSGLISSLNENVTIPTQKIEDSPILVRPILKTTIVSSIIGAFAGFFPGLGPAQAAAVGSQFVKGNFLVLVGGLGTANMVTSLATLYTLDKARNGAIVAVREMTGTIGLHDLLVFLAVALTAGCAGVLLTMFFARRFAQLMEKVNYRKMCMSVIAFIVILVIIMCGWKGLIVLFASTCVGMLAPLINVGRSHAMGCLLVPVIGWFLL